MNKKNYPFLSMLGQYFLWSCLFLNLPSLQAHPIYRFLSESELLTRRLPAAVKIQVYFSGQFVSYGSGLFLGKDGHILTNFHVLGNPLDPRISYEIILNNGERIHTAKLLQCSDDRLIDLCVLQTDYHPTEWFPVKVWSGGLGHKVIKIGHSRGMDFQTTSGFTLQRENDLPFLLDYSTRENSDVAFLEVSAGIFPGDSGGPVMDTMGDLVGMSTLKIYDVNHPSELTSRRLIISSQEIIPYFQKCLENKNLSPTPLNLISR